MLWKQDLKSTTSLSAGRQPLSVVLCSCSSPNVTPCLSYPAQSCTIKVASTLTWKHGGLPLHLSKPHWRPWRIQMLRLTSFLRLNFEYMAVCCCWMEGFVISLTLSVKMVPSFTRRTNRAGSEQYEHRLIFTIFAAQCHPAEDSKMTQWIKCQQLPRIFLCYCSQHCYHWWGLKWGQQPGEILANVQ